MRRVQRHASLERLVARIPRVAVVAASTVLAIVGVATVARPATTTPRGDAPRVQSLDLGAASLAESFARTYLEWDGRSTAENPERVDLPHVPTGIRQRVRWTTVAAASRARGVTTVVVRADTTRGVYHLAVPVGRRTDGVRYIAEPPAIVGAIPTARAPRPRELDSVTDAGLVAVTKRTLTNYLERDRADLTADLDDAAVVVLPDQDIELSAVDAVVWVTPHRRLTATVQARLEDGVDVTLRYELAVIRRAGRWLVRAIHMNPPPEVQP